MPVFEGDKAPAFCLPSDNGQSVTLDGFSGTKILLYFYPKDDTPGCTKQAIDFTARHEEFKQANTLVIGISPDSPTRHGKFRAKHDLTVILASDEEKTTLAAYGVWVEKSMYGKTYMGVERSSFLIDIDGTIAKIWRKVKVPGHVETVLAAAKAL